MSEPHDLMQQPGASPTPDADWRVCWAIAFVVAGVLYTATANRGAQWQDSGIQQVRIVTGEIANSRGLALVHPVHYYLGRAFLHLPVSEPAFAITLVSAVCGALAIANVAGTLVLLTRRPMPAVIGAGALMFAHTFWQHATHTESYALVAALLSGEWLCLAAFVVTGRAGWLIVLAACNGLGVANHLLALLATPIDAVAVLYLWRQRRCSGRCAIGAIAVWFVATMPYTALVVSEGFSSGDWVKTIRSALFGAYATDVLNTSVNPRTLLLAAGLVLYNLPNLTIPFAVGFAWYRGRYPRLFIRVVVSEFAIYTVFVARYSISDQYSYFFPVYMLIALLAGLGFGGFAERGDRPLRRTLTWSSVALLALTPVTYWVTVKQLSSRGLLASTVGAKPYRDGYAALLLPWGIATNHGDRLNAEVANLAGDHGLVVVTDTMMYHGLHYAQVTGVIPASVEIRAVEARAGDERFDRVLEAMREHHREGEAVILVPRNRDDPGDWAKCVRWERIGDVRLLVGFQP